MSNRNVTDHNGKTEQEGGRENRENRPSATAPAAPAAPAAAREERSLPVVVRRRPLAPSYGVRPVAPSELHLVEGGLPGHSKRPVAISDLKMSGTVSSYGVRPIGANTVEVTNTIILSGKRPVSASPLALAQSDSLPGKRPVASNDLGEESNLMGYLD